MKDVAVVSYCRTGIAKAQRGALNQTHGIPMLSHVMQSAAKRTGIDPGEVEDVVIGCGLPEGATGHNIAETWGKIWGKHSVRSAGVAQFRGLAARGV